MDPKTLFNSMDLGTYTLTLAPGSSAEISSLKIDNQSTHSYDILWAGVRFQNPLQAPVTLTLNYNANGGSGAPSAQTVSTTDNSYTFTIPNTVPTRTNYRFDGWCENSAGTGTVYHSGDTYTISRSDPTKTLYAKWTPYWQATLNYNANGGSGAPASYSDYISPNVTTVNIQVSSTVPTWGSFIFLGWSNSPVSGSGTPADVNYVAGDYIALTQANPTKTIYAVWEKDYRPGERKISGTWSSHNRSAGKCERKVSGTWTEMRTIDGGVGTGNEPTRKQSGTWYNQRKCGQE